MKFTVCDLETTSGEPASTELVEMYLARYSGEVLEKELHLLVRPRVWNKKADEAVKIHGITKEEIMKKGVRWGEAMRQLWDFLPQEPEHFACHANRMVFGKRGCYDWQVLALQLFDAGFEYYQYFCRMFPPQKIISTHSLSAKIMGYQKNDLKSVCTALGIPLEQHHRAKGDAIACKSIMQKLLPMVELEKFLEDDYYKPLTTAESERLKDAYGTK